MSSDNVEVLLEQSTKRWCHRINGLLLRPPRQHRLLRQQCVNTPGKDNMKNVGCLLIHANFDQMVVAMIDPI